MVYYVYMKKQGFLSFNFDQDLFSKGIFQRLRTPQTGVSLILPFEMRAINA